MRIFAAQTHIDGPSPLIDLKLDGLHGFWETGLASGWSPNLSLYSQTLYRSSAVLNHSRAAISIEIAKYAIAGVRSPKAEPRDRDWYVSR
jgi:hypothetical protein